MVDGVQDNTCEIAKNTPTWSSPRRARRSADRLTARRHRNLLDSGVRVNQLWVILFWMDDKTFYYTLGCNTAFRKDAFIKAGDAAASMRATTSGHYDAFE